MEVNTMNKDQVKGAVKQGAGKVQQETGRLVGSPEHEGKGIAKQVAGTVQKNLGDIKENIKDAVRKSR
jgi:uncharacterized protein YjbJ (UPF0337 family)